MGNSGTLKYSLRAIVPVILGYIPIGFAFGLMLSSAGFSFLNALSMSIFIYAGAAQILAVGLFSLNASLVEIAIVTFLVNSKHMFYGLSLFEKFKIMGKKKPYMIFSLTDETYALLVATKCPPDLSAKKVYFNIAFLNHCTWILGTAVGALLGSFMQFDTRGMDFALTALFLVILVEQWKSYKTKIPFIIGTFSAMIAWFFLGKQNILLFGSLFSIVFLILAKRRVEQSNVK